MIMNMDNKIDLRTAFEYYKSIYFASRNFTSTTRREYTTDILQLIGFLSSKGLTEPHSITLNHLNEYLAYLDTQSLAGATRRRKTSSIKSFFSYIEEAGYIPSDISKRLIPPKKEEQEPRVLSETEYQRLLRTVESEPKDSAIRDKAIIELLLQTGIRLSELAGLTLDDLELPTKIDEEPENAGHITVRGKGRKTRTISLNFIVCKALRNYLKARPDYGTQALFFSKFRTPISAVGYQWIIKRYLEKAGIRNAHIHTLRHTFGTHMAKNGAPLKTIQEMMGHNDLKTTSIYVSLGKKEMDKAVQTYALR